MSFKRLLLLALGTSCLAVLFLPPPAALVSAILSLVGIAYWFSSGGDYSPPPGSTREPGSTAPAVPPPLVSTDPPE